MRTWMSIYSRTFFSLLYLIVFTSALEAQTRQVSIDFSGPHVVDDLNGLDYKLDYNATYQFTVYAQCTDTIGGATLGLLMYSPDGSMVNATVGIPTLLNAWADPTVWNLGGPQVNTTLVGDSILPDQYLTGGAAFTGAGYHQPTLTPIFTFDVEFGLDEGVFCIDSAYFPPSGFWLFSTPTGDITPGWLGGAGDGPVGGSRTGALCLTIFGPPDDPPIFGTCPSGFTRSYCAAASYTVNATDPEGVDPISYSGTHDGSGSLSVNASTGSVTYTPSAGDAGNVVQVIVTASEPDGKNSDCVTNINVTQTAPNITCPANVDVTQGRTTTSGAASVSDPDGCESAVFSLVSVTPTPVGSVSVSPTSGAVTFNSDPTEPLGVDYAVCIEVTSGGQSDTCCFIMASVPDNPPVFNSCPSGLSRSYCTAASYSAAASDPEGVSAITYSGSHDGVGSLSVNSATGFTSYTPAAVDIGNVVDIVVTATESDGPSSECITSLSVSKTAPILTCPANMTVAPGSASTSNFPSVNDPDGCETRVFSLVSVTPAPIGSVTISPSNGAVTFDADATEPLGVDYTVCIQVAAGGDSSSCCFTATIVDDGPPTFELCPSDITGTHCNEITYTVRAVDPEGTDVITYGVRANGLGSVAIVPTTGATTYIPSPSDAGKNVEVIVTATESDGLSSECVTNIALTRSPPTVTCPPDVDVSRGKIVYTDPPIASDADECDPIWYSIATVSPTPIGSMLIDEFTGVIEFIPGWYEPVPRDYEVCIRAYSGGESDICCLTISYIESCCLVAGDANGDGVVTIEDVAFLVRQIFRGGPHGPCQDSEDANGDNNINIIDIVYPIDYIFRGGPAPVCGTTGG